MKSILRIFVLATILLFCGLMLQLSLPYLIPPFATDIDFLITKQDVLGVTGWRYAFYVHISTSLLTLASGLTQFSKTIYTRFPRVHRWVGTMYVFTLLVFSAPTGLVLARYANGGGWTQTAFSLLAVCWWWFTFQAYRAVRRHDFGAHAAYMWRSYALTWSAVSLRAMQFLVGYWALCDYETSYLVSAWAGWTGNWLIAELTMPFFLAYFNTFQGERDTKHSRVQR